MTPFPATSLRFLDRSIAVLSWLTLAALVVLSVVRRLGVVAMPWSSWPWVEVWLIPVLTAGAVGYLTNYLAIWLLFRPYAKHGPFWGVIPRNQPRLAETLGKTIPERLLPPAELAQTIIQLASEFLRNPATMARIRGGIVAAVKAHGPELTEVLMPYLRMALEGILHDQLRAKKVAKVLDGCAEAYLAQPEHRAKIAQELLEVVKPRIPQLLILLRSGMREAAIVYIKQRFGMMAMMLGGAETIVDGIVEHLNWQEVEGRIADQLAAPETQQLFADEIGRLGESLRGYLATPEAQIILDQEIANRTPQIEEVLAAYLRQKLPEALELLLNREDLWRTIDEQAMPFLQQIIEQELKENSDTVIARLNLPGRIEAAVNGLKPEEAHHLINEVAARELTLLQVLGFFLGAVAGMLMTLSL